MCRNLKCIICFLIAMMLAVCFTMHGLAEGYPESEHPYAENSDITWTYTHPQEAYALKITFSEDTELEEGWDYLYVIGEDGTQQKYSGTALQGESVYVIGDSFTLRLTSDSSYNKNGFTVTAVESLTQAEYEEYIATPRYTINASGVITAYSGQVAELVIPAEIDGVTVTGIGESAFRDSTVLTSVVFPDSVTSIGDYAFSVCKNLTSVSLPDSLTKLGMFAFSGCSSLTHADLPDGVKSLGMFVFSGCSSLKNVNLPDSVIEIGDDAFYACISLASIDLPDGITSIGNSVFYNCSGLTGIVLPDKVTSIGNYAFSGCSSLTSIVLQDSVTNIGKSAFSNCDSLTVYCNAGSYGASAVTADGVGFIDSDYPDYLLHQYPDDTGVYYLSIAEYLGDDTSVIIPSAIKNTSVKCIGEDAFHEYRNLKDITLPDGLTSIGNSAFYECRWIERINFPDSVTSIGTYAFSNCRSLTDIDLPDGLTSISNYAFYYCEGLTSIDLPAGLTSIGENAFRHCSRLRDIVLPAGVKDIEMGAFGDCSDLTSINLPNGLTHIAIGMFNGCSSLSSIVVPDGVTEIGSSAFQNCTSLTSVILPDEITFIDDFAFYNCQSLTSIDMPDELTSMGGLVFYNCSQLTSIVLPDGLVSMEASTFEGCSSLTDVVLPEGLTSISSMTFYECDRLTNITLPTGVTDIGSYAFYGCSNLISVGCLDNVTSIGKRAFYGCNSIKEIVLSDSLTSIGDEAFPVNTILRFGSSDVIRQYAIDNGLQYISDSESSLRDPIDTLEDKMAWILDTQLEPGMSEYEIALTLHDWIVAHVAYDYDYLDTDIPTSEYGVGGEAAIMDGWAVCHGYAQSFEWLLEEAGMEVRYVTGYNHAWNLVKVDGDWYHFDLTWDDTGGGGRYDYFGLSDMAIHTEPKNHATQYDYRHVTCDSWEANYYYRNGYLDSALAALRSGINENIAAGTYSGTITLSSSPSGQYSRYTLALILGNDSDWTVSGRVEITPQSGTKYDFVFYPDEAPVTAIHVDGISGDVPDFYTMYPGYAAQMNVSTVPAGREVSYASSDESVLTVSQDGLVTAVGSGEAYITLTAGNFRKAFSIYVRSSSWLLDSYSCYLDIGVTEHCALDSYYDWFLTDTADVWTSSDESVVTVDHDGMITSVGYGKATVTLTTGAGMTDDMTVYVRKPVTAVVFNRDTYEVYEGLDAGVRLHAEGCDQDFYRENFTYFTYTSSDESIADVRGYYSPVWNEETGRWIYRPWINYLAPGEVTLTATARDGSGVSGSCRIIVKEAPKLTDMRFVLGNYEAAEGEIIELVLRTQSDDPNYYKENYGSFTYTSSDEAIADYYHTAAVWNEEAGCWEYTVKVRCLAPGEVTFFAAAKDNSGLAASCRIVVSEGPKLTGLTFEAETYEGYAGEYLVPSLYAYGEDPDFYKENYGSFTYTIGDTTIARTSGWYSPSWNEEAGCWVYSPNIQLLAPGEVTLTAAAQDKSGLTASCTIVVKENPKLNSMAFNERIYKGHVGQEIILSLYASGDDPDFYKEHYGYFSYTVSDETIAQYDGSYYPVWNETENSWEYMPTFDLLAPGEVTVTAVAADGSGLTASCTIVVSEPEPLFYEYPVYEAYEGSRICTRLHADVEDPDAYYEAYGSFTTVSDNVSIAKPEGSYSPYWDSWEGYWVYQPAVRCVSPGVTTITSRAKDTSGLSAACTVIVHSNAPLALPKAMKTIRDEAFLGTAAEEIVLPEGIVSIGQRAFAQSKTLKLINLPESLESIAEDAFDGSENVALICTEGSEGQRFAQENGIPYVVK